MCGCIWRASKPPSSPLLSPPSVLSAWRICQFSFSLFVPALILLSKPWLASLTAAEHRSYSTPTNNTHSCHAGRMHSRTHIRTNTHTHKRSHLLFHLLPLSALAHSKICNSSAHSVLFCKLSELIAFTQPSVCCNPALTL